MKYALIILLLPMMVKGQSGKKGTSNRLREITRLADSNLMANCALAQDLTGLKFINWFMNGGSTDGSKRFYGARIDSLGADDSFAYYALAKRHFPLDFVKVGLDQIRGLHLSAINADTLRRRFIDEIVPLEDKHRVEKSQYNWASETRDFSFVPDTESRTILFTCKWTVKHDFATVLNRTYTATYDLASKSFSDGTAVVKNRTK